MSDQQTFADVLKVEASKLVARAIADPSFKPEFFESPQALLAKALRSRGIAAEEMALKADLSQAPQTPECDRHLLTLHWQEAEVTRTLTLPFGDADAFGISDECLSPDLAAAEAQAPTSCFFTFC